MMWAYLCLFLFGWGAFAFLVRRVVLQQELRRGIRAVPISRESRAPLPPSKR
jgi:hypothetical protein